MSSTSVTKLSWPILRFVAAAAIVSLFFVKNAWAGGPPPPPPPTYSTACSGYPCGLSNAELLRQVLSSGTYATITQAIEFVSTYFKSGFGRQANAPGGTRFALSGDGDTGKAASAGETASWNGWVSAAQANVGTSFNPLKSDGPVRAGLIGVDYTFGNKAVLGVALADTSARIDTKFNGGKFSSDGITVSPYLLYPLNSNWALNAGLGFGHSNLKSFDNTNGIAVTGRNSSDTTLANLGLEYNRILGNWAFTGRTGISYYRDKQSSQTLSNGTFISGSDTSASQIRVGGEIAYDAGAWMPFAGLTYIYDPRLPTQGTVSGQTPSNDKNAVQATLGIQYRSRGALYGGLQLTTERGRSDMKNDAAMLNVGMYF